MNQHLFKLKKNGETVGYLELVGGVPSPATAAERPLTAIAGLRWYNAQRTVMASMDIEIQWDTAHPFVTKDKNGKDVFADDKIKAVILDISSSPLIGRIVPNDSSLSCWMFEYRLCNDLDKHSKKYLAPAPDLQEIELIGDKEE